ncbi:hypothetical protein [Mucilaginibacter kameinonensis]|uniref:hypothetical protein n=1 Tax=Mucilaginibacter kameinonensis TaxID=452286 RepID=UPI000EF850A3|nr:hypothetical protein [Mucilaginibacter kameinonensis]
MSKEQLIENIQKELEQLLSQKSTIEENLTKELAEAQSEFDIKVASIKAKWNIADIDANIETFQEGLKVFKGEPTIKHNPVVKKEKGSSKPAKPAGEKKSNDQKIIDVLKVLGSATVSEVKEYLNKNGIHFGSPVPQYLSNMETVKQILKSDDNRPKKYSLR